MDLKGSKELVEVECYSVFPNCIQGSKRRFKVFIMRLTISYRYNIFNEQIKVGKNNFEKRIVSLQNFSTW